MAHIDDPETQRANTHYIQNAMDEPMLEKEKEQELARRWKDKRDEAALHELIQSYTRLAISLAMKFKNYGLPVGDLIQEGNIGLMMAAQRFDPDRDLRFSTYASWWIRSSIQDYVLRNWSIVRTGTTSAHKSLFFNMRRLQAKIEKANEHYGLNEKGREEIAKELGVNKRDVVHMEARLGLGDQSLNAKIGDDTHEEFQSLLQDDVASPEDVVIGMKDAKTRSEWLNNALQTLPEREQKIVRDRHLGEETVTLDSLGKALGISKERVRQLEKRAMDKIKDNIIKNVNTGSELFEERY